MERLGDTVEEGLVAAAARSGLAVVYCNGKPVPVVEGCCSGCGEQLPWVVTLADTVTEPRL